MRSLERLRITNQVNKLLNKICSIFLPGQIYIHHNKFERYV